MRFLIVLCLPVMLLAQTKADPSQVKDPGVSTSNYVLCSVGGKTGWCQGPPEWAFIATTKPLEWKITVNYTWPELVTLTTRVAVLESKVDPQPVDEIIVVTADGQSFQLAGTPQWGYVIVVRNGLVQAVSQDYTYASGKITFNAGIPIKGDIVVLKYWK